MGAIAPVDFWERPWERPNCTHRFLGKTIDCTHRLKILKLSLLLCQSKRKKNGSGHKYKLLTAMSIKEVKKMDIVLLIFTKFKQEINSYISRSLTVWNQLVSVPYLRGSQLVVPYKTVPYKKELSVRPWPHAPDSQRLEFSNEELHTSPSRALQWRSKVPNIGWART